MQYLDAISKTIEWSVCFQGKPFNITVIHVYAPVSNIEEAEDEQYYEDPQDLLELTLKRDVLFIIGIEWWFRIKLSHIKLLWPVHSLGKTLLAFALLRFVLQGQICLLLQVSLDFLLCIPFPYDEKDIFLGC